MKLRNIRSSRYRRQTVEMRLRERFISSKVYAKRLTISGSKMPDEIGRVESFNFVVSDCA